jgi:NitT/TauT family transport system permease protein
VKQRQHFRIPALVWQLLIVAGVLAVWEYGNDLHTSFPHLMPDIFDPYFISQPSEIATRFLSLTCIQSSIGDWNHLGDGSFSACLAKNPNNLWAATAATLRNTLFGFAAGVSSGFVLGLLLGRSARLSEIFGPFVSAVNSIPRIALAPIIILAFGLGDVSKVVTSWIVVVFLVFFNTFAGARSVDAGYLDAARLLGASPWYITRTVIIPSTSAWVFASLSPAVSLALIGVIVGEFIGAQRGIGRLIIEAQARAEAASMMVAVIVLMIVGMMLSYVIGRIQNHLLRWQTDTAR